MNLDFVKGGITSLWVCIYSLKIKLNFDHKNIVVVFYLKQQHCATCPQIFSSTCAFFRSITVCLTLPALFQVYQLPVQDCHKYSDCEKCTQARDPYCGWCVREGR